MCHPVPVLPSSSPRNHPPPEVTLAHALNHHLGSNIIPSSLREFLINHWNLVQICAHAIHEEGHNEQN